jgi:hypothetical protein
MPNKVKHRISLEQPAVNLKGDPFPILFWPVLYILLVGGLVLLKFMQQKSRYFRVAAPAQVVEDFSIRRLNATI